MMFLQEPLVPEIRITNIYDEPMFTVKEVDGETKRVPWTLKFRDFLLERATDPKFYEKKDGLEAVELAVLTRAAIKAGPVSGVYLLEDEVAKRLKDVCLKPSQPYERAYHHNYLDFLKAVAAMSDKDPRVALAPAPQIAEPSPSP